jgi:hypothetical protein
VAERQDWLPWSVLVFSRSATSFFFFGYMALKILPLLFLGLGACLFYCWVHCIEDMNNSYTGFFVIILLGYLFCFILISCGCLTNPTFFFAMSQFDWSIAQTKRWNHGEFQKV